MDDQELEKLKDLAELIKSKIEYEHTPSLLSPEELAQQAIEARKNKDKELHVDLKKIKEEQRIVLGFHEVFGKISKEIGFDKLLTSRHGESANKILRDIVIARIANPTSKRSSIMMLEEDFGIRINLDKVYRMMDKLDEAACLKIQELSYQATLSLFKEKINIIFFDVTTLYFESFSEDELKRNGFSKDHKFNQPQVLLSLMVTKDGLPIGYDVFPGSSYEGHTLCKALEKVKNTYEIDKIVFVADAGIFNTSNLQLLEEHGYNYIIAARLKNLSKEWKEKILNHDYSKETIVSFNYDGRKLIVNYNKERAVKNKLDREKAINKLLQKLRKNKTPLNLISNYGYKKYIKTEGKATISVDKQKIEEDSKWDGLHAVITNCHEMNEKETLSHYRGLWQVEESFRITKHDLKVRPIYHWTPSRVRAHIAISYLAFCLVRHLEYRVSIQYKKLSPKSIVHSLSKVQASILRDRDGKRYVLPSEFTQDAKKIYQLMGLETSITPYRLESKSCLNE